MIDTPTGKYGVCASLKLHSKAVNDLDWNSSGDFLLSSSDDETICLFSIGAEGAHCRKRILDSEYGVSAAKWSRRSHPTVIVAGEPEIGATLKRGVGNGLLGKAPGMQQPSLRELDLYTCQFTRCFKTGARISQLEVHPLGDCFLSCGVDGAVRVFDKDSGEFGGNKSLPSYILRSSTDAHDPSPVSASSMGGAGGGSAHTQTCAAIEPQGTVSAVSLGDKIIRFYDCRNWMQPYGICDLSGVVMPSDAEITALTWDPHSCCVLAATDSHQLLLINSVTKRVECQFPFGIPQHNLTRHRSPGRPVFSPDGNFLLCGGQDGNVHMWNVRDVLAKAAGDAERGALAEVPGSQVPVASDKWAHALGGHQGTPLALAFNPRWNMFASACINVALWCPS